MQLQQQGLLAFLLVTPRGMPPRLQLHERVTQDIILVAADCPSAETFKLISLRSSDKGRGVCKGSTHCCPIEHVLHFVLRTQVHFQQVTHLFSVGLQFLLSVLLFAQCLCTSRPFSLLQEGYNFSQKVFFFYSLIMQDFSRSSDVSVNEQGYSAYSLCQGLWFHMPVTCTSIVRISRRGDGFKIIFPRREGTYQME